jgi:sugar phosphate isomerase/epimerase
MSYEKLAIHTFTNRPWSIDECVRHYAARGIGGISIWRETIAGKNLTEVRRQVEESGLQGISLVRGGFFTGSTEAVRQTAHETNLRCIEEAAALGLPMIVLVCGATPGQTARDNYLQIRDGIARMAEPAAAAGVRLAIEPLHPIYAGDRSGICSLRSANDLAEELNLANVGIAVDVYHVFWEVDLEEQLQRCAGAGRLDAYHICDFKPNQDHILLDRGLMGEGCINLSSIDRWVRGTGFGGFAEVEIFSRHWWSQDQHHFLDRILEAYDRIYS